MDIQKILCDEFSLKPNQAANTIKLIEEGNTIPFIARYRKEATGSLDDAVLRNFSSRLKYLLSLEERKNEIKRLISEQGKLTDELSKKIEKASSLNDLEDLYRPYRPKRKTRASAAREKGLEPLADIILAQTEPIGTLFDIAEKFAAKNTEIKSAQEAIGGAYDIIAELISDNADYRKAIKSKIKSKGVLRSQRNTADDSVYDMYSDFSEKIKSAAPHRILAMNRGEKEGALSISVETDFDECIGHICNQMIKNTDYADIINEIATDAFKRLLLPSMEREIRNELTEAAQKQAISLFSKNLYQLLMQPPFKGMTVLGVDPGYRTGCKLAVVDETGCVLDTGVIFCTLEHHDKKKSAEAVKKLIEKYNINLIAIGNGTASKETEIFISGIIKELDRELYYIMVSEAGASVYSASELASEEFPDLTVEGRSAASIARRIQDPLAELVKIDPKSIGVGQYQHDINQKELTDALDGVVENCVNSVGVDLNTASAPLLSHVAGINSAVAKNIVSFREKNGKFTSRKQLLKVNKLGEKAFTQCAGFLKISDAENPLDSTAVHPESYKCAEDILSSIKLSAKEARQCSETEFRKKLAAVDTETICAKYGIGRPTFDDITEALLRPDRDPRDEIPKPILMSDILSIEDLRPGMVLTGTVRNVIDFGAFVDIGVHQDGLVHISEISSKYISHPTQVLAVGDVVKVKVLGTDVSKKRISLSMKDV